MLRHGVVLIGRNEGERLRRCLKSVFGSVQPVVYVDSGSTDGSCELAACMHADVVQLDMTLPFSAARARNAGFARLMERYPNLKFVQFVDGDCEVAVGWLEHAEATLAAQSNVAIVCGRRRERLPGASIYNRLCDLEWNTPVGEAKSCGGDAMVRVAALQQVGGYDPKIVAGEEPELCVRLRQQGWRILRLDAEMTLHDAAMMRFGQWWTRAVRAGHAYAEGATIHGSSPQRHNLKEVRSIMLWGLLLPMAVAMLAWPTRGLCVFLLIGYLVLWLRVLRARQHRGDSSEEARLYATFCILAKFAQLGGMVMYLWNRGIRGQQPRLIEYKWAANP